MKTQLIDRYGTEQMIHKIKFLISLLLDRIEKNLRKIDMVDQMIETNIWKKTIYGIRQKLIDHTNKQDIRYNVNRQRKMLIEEDETDDRNKHEKI